MRNKKTPSVNIVTARRRKIKYTRTVGTEKKLIKVCRRFSQIIPVRKCTAYSDDASERFPAADLPSRTVRKPLIINFYRPFGNEPNIFNIYTHAHIYIYICILYVHRITVHVGRYSCSCFYVPSHSVFLCDCIAAIGLSVLRPLSSVNPNKLSSEKRKKNPMRIHSTAATVRPRIEYVCVRTVKSDNRYAPIKYAICQFGLPRYGTTRAASPKQFASVLFRQVYHSRRAGNGKKRLISDSEAVDVNYDITIFRIRVSLRATYVF